MAKFTERKILLVSQFQVDTVIALAKNVPLDIVKPIEVVFREQVHIRKSTQNSLLWAGALNDIAKQAWVQGKQFSAEVWHYYCKGEYLPEDYIEGITKDGYRKWDFDPKGERVLIGSTTQLTTSGFSEYMENIYAHGANMGVQFSTNRHE